jgi:Tn3 transposase DDE domain
MNDTLDFTEHLVGQCYFLGYIFMPRLKDLTDQHLYRLDRQSLYGLLNALFYGQVDLDLLPEQVDQLVRVAASLGNRATLAHMTLQRLENSADGRAADEGRDGLGSDCEYDLHPPVYARPRPQEACPVAAQPWGSPSLARESALLCESGGVSHRRLRGDSEQSDLSEPALQCRAGVEYRAHDRAPRPTPGGLRGHSY